MTSFALIGILSDQEVIDRDAIDLLAAENDEHHAHLKSIQEERVQVKKDFDEVSERVAQWAKWQKIGQYTAATGALAFGASTMSPLLLTAGTVNIANRVITDLDGWKTCASIFTPSESAQEKVSRTIDLAVSLSTTITGLGAAYFAWQIPTGMPVLSLEMPAMLEALPIDLDRFGKWVVLTTQVLSSTASVFKSRLEKEQLTAQAHLSELSAGETEAHEDVQQYAGDAARLFDTNKIITETTQTCVTALTGG